MSTDRTGRIASFAVNMIAGSKAPRFDAATHELTPLAANITEQGMQSGLPMVDMLFEHDGKRFGWITSGRMFLMVGAAVQAAVVRQGREPDYVPVVLAALEGKHPQAGAFTKASDEIADTIRRSVTGATAVDFDALTFREAVRSALIELLQ